MGPSEITDYAGIEIEWKRGKKAILSIFDDEHKHLEDIKLYELKTRTEMHKLLVDKGFTKKTEEQKQAEIREATVESQLRAIGQPSAVYGNMSYLYFLAFAMLVVGGLGLHRKKGVKRLFNSSPLTRV